MIYILKHSIFFSQRKFHLLNISLKNRYFIVGLGNKMLLMMFSKNSKYLLKPNLKYFIIEHYSYFLKNVYQFEHNSLIK